MLGISKREDKSISKGKENSSKVITPLYSKPKILLVDLPKELSESLKSEGFNVSHGTFGSPYKVEVSEGLLPVITNGNLPNISEQEVIFIDLSVSEILDKPGEYEETKDNQFWSSCSSGIIDPRKITMALASEHLDRTLNHGGFIVIFAQPRAKETYIWGKDGFRGVTGSKHFWDNLSFLSILNETNLYIEYVKGEEIEVKGNDHEIFKFLRKNIKDATFNAIFDARYQLTDKWTPLLTNKFGNDVGGLILSNDFNGGGVLVLPQLHKTPDVILGLLNEVIPEFAPQLFPHLEGAKWVERNEYELEDIKKYKQEKIEVKKKMDEDLAALNEKIQRKREEFGFLHGILTKTGDELVEDVKKCLEFIGFKQIVDVDKTIDEGSKREEDLQIHDESPALLVEIKGISGYLKDEDILQVHKYIPRRMKEWKRFDIRGASIINYQRNTLAFKRDPIEEDKIEDIESHEITLVSTVDLFVLIRGMIRWNWNPKVIKDLFYEIGKIPNIPANYKPIGEIFTYIKDQNIIGINVTSGKLYKGQKIGYNVDNEFLEEEVTSLQVNNQDVEEASSGQAGIKTAYSEKELKNGTIVYEITE